jgi:hypothetical protein
MSSVCKPIYFIIRVQEESIVQKTRRANKHKCKPIYVAVRFIVLNLIDLRHHAFILAFAIRLGLVRDRIGNIILVIILVHRLLRNVR